MKVNSVITLDDDVNVLILDETVFEGEKYYYVVALDDNNEPQEDYAYLKEIIENDGKYVEKVEDPNLIITLTEIFTRLLDKTVDEIED